MSRTKHHGDKAKERVFGKGWRWLDYTPGWWVRLFMTKPQRQRVRKLSEELKRLADLEDAPEFPVAKKPHNYYF
ncbi:MAG: hypothetical protein KKD77_20505 [Gammaproteobacteria bacterium]|nr:hypothetical protein [Gammaproteobacteria bacterium]